MIKAFFICFPFVVCALVMLGFVFPSCRALQCRSRVKVLLLLIACSKFLLFWLLGGDAFNPELPAAVIWTMNWAYSGVMLLLGLLCVWIVGDVLTSAAIRFCGFRPCVSAARLIRVRAILLPVLAWSLAAWGVASGVGKPSVRELTFEFDNLPASMDGYRIVQISDLHVSSAARRWRTQAVVDAVNALHADLVVCTGDVVDGQVAHRFVDVEPLKDLRAADGVYFCTGNHEYYADWLGWRDAFSQLGLRFLCNEHVVPREGLVLAGVPDSTGADLGEDVAPDVGKAFAGAPKGAFRVLLAHRPVDARLNVEAHGVNLQFSGHTHGGVAPGVTLLVALHNYGFVRGPYRCPHGMLYVSPGTGQWAGFPVRFLNAPEIAVVTLRRVGSPAR